ncbi:rhamnulokinase [Corynebacterium uterequi]|uniref:Pentulose/hexulose kinase n=1 Tax=Corynebacterium uterequi TaxID=1072256 RepID=A0A0G3HJ17_9CORY|nr:FGGY-family carbohydrate kinase [Corynebacterium uterequi]AKK11948.1 pentulose/hexulose kinase [Corynebacterium uterequi]
MSITSLAIDLGSSSAKAVLGTIDDEGFSFNVIDRFEHSIINRDGQLFWDIDALEEGCRRVIDDARRRLAATGKSLDSVAIDTWGVDYVWVDDSGAALSAPHSYRDPRGQRNAAAYAAKVGAERQWQTTGNQLESILTSVQMLDEKVPAGTAGFLFLPDYLTHRLGGSANAGRGIASTSGLVNASTGTWATDLFDSIGIDSSLAPQLQDEATIAGYDGDLAIIRAGSHDTACAVAALLDAPTGSVFISAGSWSILGMITAAPVLTDAARTAGLSNEACADGRNRLLKNATGLWLTQEARRAWARAGEPYTFAELAELAAHTTSTGAIIDPLDPRLSEPGDMPELIRRLCQEQGDVVPRSPGQVCRIITDSLAASHRTTIADLESVTGTQVHEIRMVGGGIRDHVLCQATADATGVAVVAGPIEASALGNLAVQFSTLGHPLPADAFTTTTYQPQC